MTVTTGPRSGGTLEPLAQSGHLRPPAPSHGGGMAQGRLRSGPSIGFVQPGGAAAGNLRRLTHGAHEQ